VVQKKFWKIFKKENRINDSKREIHLEELDTLLARRWKEALSSRFALKLIKKSRGIDRRIYAMYVIQIYHWAYHTGRTLAITGANPFNTNHEYMDFCYKHAREENGHELMALSDLREMGVPIQNPAIDMPPPLPGTEVLIAFVRWMATQKNPHRILGYDYWTENPYKYINSTVLKMAGNFGLKQDQMSFFFKHKNIDIHHEKDIEEILLKVCKTEEDWDMVKETATTTMKILFDMIEDLFDSFEKLKKGQMKKYEILNQMPGIKH